MKEIIVLSFSCFVSNKSTDSRRVQCGQLQKKVQSSSIGQLQGECIINIILLFIKEENSYSLM